jgi:hypothetical protein
MNLSVAIPAECDEVLFDVVAELTSGRDVVNF